MVSYLGSLVDRDPKELVAFPLKDRETRNDRNGKTFKPCAEHVTFQSCDQTGEGPFRFQVPSLQFKKATGERKLV
jgi:hypothetical protein